ncbi:MAG: pyrroloquinoline quinone biosynthesis protein PqqB [Firmicutes bacterium]|nr:pyrroloquinoline quinone biosynthesis protein PqqB [Bacillota bacterium]
MRVRILGSAAGGGLPQWNCNCPNCAAARAGAPTVRRRTQTSLAVSADGETWYLVNATPDIREQLAAFPALHPGPGVRETPVRGVLLTDAELDHTGGLLVLREGSRWRLFCTPAVRAVLERRFPVLPILQAFAQVEVVPVLPGEPFALGEGAASLRVTAFPLLGGLPLYAADLPDPGPGAVVGYRFEDPRTGGVLVVAPGVGALTAELERQLAGADCVLFDGTCWSDDELVRLGIRGRTARAMGHVPVGGPDGSAVWLARQPVRRKIYIHVNNTNPMVREDGPEYRWLAAHGLEVAHDGMEVEL